MSERFFFDQDGNSHWYIVPAARRAEWDAWCALDEDNEDAWDAPEWAQRLGGGPHSWTFSDPKGKCDE